jgi:hypothetical protein
LLKNSRQKNPASAPFAKGGHGEIMDFKNKTIRILLSVFLFAFLFGVIKLFIMRFETGDVYPVYSSLRADPLGTKIFYESLNTVRGISVQRNYQSVSKLMDQQKKTIFFFGLHSHFLRYADKNDINILEDIVSGGGRLVILLYPSDKKRAASGDKDNKEEKKSLPCKDYDDCKSRSISLMDRWGFTLACNESPEATEPAREAKRMLVTNKYHLPDSLSWHSPEYFTNIDDKWEKAYTLNENPVVIDRPFGKGSIVLSTDTYFVSNEAMRKERHPELLVWLVGNNNKMIFDESHFGIRENPGIAALIQKYHLHGLFVGVILLIALFIWKNSFSLVPPHDEKLMLKEKDISTGKDYISGFVSLLRRNIKTRDVLTVCFKEWQKTFSHRSKDLNSELKQMQSIIESSKALPAKQQNPLKAYQQISKILSERKT